MITYAVLDTRHRKSSRNSEYCHYQRFMYEKFREEKIVEAKIQRLRNAMGMMDTMVPFQNGAWHARNSGCYCKVSRWHRLRTDTAKIIFVIKTDCFFLLGINLWDFRRAHSTQH